MSDLTALAHDPRRDFNADLITQLQTSRWMQRAGTGVGVIAGIGFLTAAVSALVSALSGPDPTLAAIHVPSVPINTVPLDATPQGALHSVAGAVFELLRGTVAKTVALSVFLVGCCLGVLRGSVSNLVVGIVLAMNLAFLPGLLGTIYGVPPGTSPTVTASAPTRENLTIRMGMRRLTRLTNAFSKKVENHAHAVALHFLNYNFARIHKTLRVTPAMEAGISDHVWSLAEIAELPDKIK